MQNQTPPYFHVVARLGGDDRRLLFADLSERDLRDRFIKSYNRAEKVLIGGEVIDLAQLRELKITRTAGPKALELETLNKASRVEIDRLNNDLSWGGFMISAGSGLTDEEIADVGDDVTGTYVSKAPGATTILGQILAHPWIAGITTTIIAGLVLAWVFGVGD